MKLIAACLIALIAILHAMPAEAAAKRKRQVVRAPAPVLPAPMVRPPWATYSPYECWTDEGYGRFRECSRSDRPD